MKRTLRLASDHFELMLYVGFWINASLLAAIAGRPHLGAVGLVTVLPFVVVYVARSKP